MRSRVRNAFEVLGMSALDLFASSLGVFVLVTFVLLPFYLWRWRSVPSLSGCCWDNVIEASRRRSGG